MEKSPAAVGARILQAIARHFPGATPLAAAIRCDDGRGSRKRHPTLAATCGYAPMIWRYRPSQAALIRSMLYQSSTVARAARPIAPRSSVLEHLKDGVGERRRSVSRDQQAAAFRHHLAISADIRRYDGQRIGHPLEQGVRQVLPPSWKNEDVRCREKRSDIDLLADKMNSDVDEALEQRTGSPVPPGRLRPRSVKSPFPAVEPVGVLQPDLHTPFRRSASTP